tara:strand:+ start:610 stop:1689 length:1080 start_codon:yes stop_codon:yes gene_type:complete
MITLKENQKESHILIIGSGIIGKFNALVLSRLGYQVQIIDPFEINNSSNASLGILMGNIYQKRKGRSWELRKESIALWPKWLKEFNQINPKLTFDKPFLQMTTNEDRFKKMQNFALNHPLDNLKILDTNSKILKNIHEVFCNSKIKGIISFDDGRVEPKFLLRTLDILLQRNKVITIKDKVIKISHEKKNWFAHLSNGNKICSEIIVLCNSLNTLNLIDNKKYNFELEPILGQAVEIVIKNESIDFSRLPKVMNINNKNVIPITKNKIIIGSTDEHNIQPIEDHIQTLINFIEDKPFWLDKKNISKKWFGIRSRPVGEGSPLLKSLEQGLILCAGFYKNGILLAPACAKWLSKEIIKHI